jgi:hypothetical protein
MTSTDKITTNKRTTCKWEISDEVQKSVDQYIKNNPSGYKNAQNFGEFISTHPQFSNTDELKIDQVDIFGETILYDELCKNINYYGMTIQDLSSDEINILKKYKGDEWNLLFF